MKKTKLSAIIIMALIVFTSCLSREERNKKAEETGQSQVEEKASFIKGVGEGLKGVGKDAVESVSEGVGELVKGGNQGLDNSLVKKEVRVAENVKEFVTVSRSEVHQNDSTLEKEIIVYTIFEKNFDGKLVLKAFDKKNEEIGRSVVSVKEESDNSRFIEFPFDKRTSFSLIQYLVLENKSK